MPSRGKDGFGRSSRKAPGHAAQDQLKLHGNSSQEKLEGSEPPSSIDEKGQTDSAKQREVQNVGADKKTS